MFDPKTPWKSTQNRTKTTPRGDFFALRFAPLFLIDFCSVLAPKMPPFGHPFCSQNRSKKSSNIELTQKSLQDHPISPQDGPRSPQEAPRGSQERPQKPKKHPKRAQDRPKKLQEAPKRGPKSPKAPQEGPRSPQEAPRGSQERP